MDTDGRLLMADPTPADISDLACAQAILDAIRKRWPWVKYLVADEGYDRLKLMDKAAYLDFLLEIIRRSESQRGFEVLPRRWVVERTFGWMTCWRRLVRDYERRIDVSHAMLLVAMGGNSLRRTLTGISNRLREVVDADHCRCNLSGWKKGDPELHKPLAHLAGALPEKRDMTGEGWLCIRRLIRFHHVPLAGLTVRWGRHHGEIRVLARCLAYVRGTRNGPGRE